MRCLRDGCGRPAATRDEFCSAVCARIHHGVPVEGDVYTDADRREAKNRRARVKRLQKKLGGTDMTVVNPDAMAHRAKGSFESGRGNR